MSRGRSARVAGDLSNEGKNGSAGWGVAIGSGVAEQTDAISGAATLADGISTGVMVMGQVVAMVRETVRDLVAELVGKLISSVLEEACTLGFAIPLVAVQATTAITNTISEVGDLFRKLVKTIGIVSPKIRDHRQARRDHRETVQAGQEVQPPRRWRHHPAHTASHVDSPRLAGDVTTPSHAHTPDGPPAPSGTHTPDTARSADAPTDGGTPGTTGGAAPTVRRAPAGPALTAGSAPGIWSPPPIRWGTTGHWSTTPPDCPPR
jgi:hypothetical protein